MPGKYSEPERPGPVDASRRRLLIAACAIGAAALALASAFSLASCSRSSPKAGKPQAGAAAPRAALPPSAPLPSQAGAPAGAGAAKPAALAGAPPAALAAPLRGFGLKVASVPRIARDYSLGPLQSWRPAAGDEAAVFATATAFMEGIAAGKLEKQLLLPQSRDALSALLAPPGPGSAPRSAIPYRLGAIALRGPDASLRLRLPAAAGAGREEGLLSLRKSEGTWYVEALALDARAAGAPAFDPNAGGAGSAR
jgi:hypothetical protein